MNGRGQDGTGEFGAELAHFFDASAEHSPMSGLDELLIHNHPHPVRVMWTGDSQAYERMWFTAQDHVGDLHTTVRAHRRLGDNRVDMTVGPITFELIEPFRQWRNRLEDNEFGIDADLSWFDSKRPIYRQLGAGVIFDGRPFDGVAGYDGFRHQSGVVTVRGERFELSRDTAPPFGRVGRVRGLRAVGRSSAVQPRRSTQAQWFTARARASTPVRTRLSPVALR